MLLWLLSRLFRFLAAHSGLGSCLRFAALLCFLLLGLFLGDGNSHRRSLCHGLITGNHQVPQHGIVEFERALDFLNHRKVALDVEQRIVCFVDLVDRVRQLTPAPVFRTVNIAAGFGHHAMVALYHGRNLLALVRMNQKHYLVMSHLCPLRITATRPPGVARG